MKKIKFKIEIDGKIFTKSACRHFYYKTGTKNRRVSKEYFNRRLVWAQKVHVQACKPYVTVFHVGTGRAFQLNRGYRLIDTANMKKVDNIVNDWPAWAPTQDNQRPAWAQGLKDSEFHAYWHFT